MLYEFLTSDHEKLISHCKKLAAAQGSPRVPGEAMQHGVPIFLNLFVDTLRSDPAIGLGNKAIPAIGRTGRSQPTPMSESVTEHRRELFDKACSFDQVVHACGDVCGTVTELADRSDAPLASHKFKILNRCLDGTMVAAVTELARNRCHTAWESSNLAVNARLRDLPQGPRFDLHRRESIALQTTANTATGQDGTR